MHTEGIKCQFCDLSECKQPTNLLVWRIWGWVWVCQHQCVGLMLNEWKITKKVSHSLFMHLWSRNDPRKLQHSHPGPSCSTMSRLVFQPMLEEPGTNGQDSGEDKSEGEGLNAVVNFAPDIKPSTPPVNCQYQMWNSLLQAVEEVCKLGQMRQIDDLG